MATTRKKSKEKLSSPIEQIHHALSAFFKGDEAIVVGDQIDYDNYTLDITVSDADKFAALSRVLKKHFEFGNMHLDIIIKYQPVDEEGDDIEDMKVVLEGNPLFKKFECVKEAGLEFNFCIFKKEVVQYFDDILSDLYGLKSTLAQDMAPELFETSTPIMYCTDSN